MNRNRVVIAVSPGIKYRIAQLYYISSRIILIEILLEEKEIEIIQIKKYLFLMIN